MSRRTLVPDPAVSILAEAVTTKLLNAWLQNRHQTLVPLALNLRILSAEQRADFLAALAALLLTGRPREAATAALPELRSWLAKLGAGPEDLQRFEAAFAQPSSLGEIFDRAPALGLPAYLYLAALAAADPRSPASLLLCDVVQARFDLGTPIIRSITRRYRR